MMSSNSDRVFPDWERAQNIHFHPDTYELENQALARDGKLDIALKQVQDWTGKDVLDIGCGTGFWLESYAADATRVIGVEPDPMLLETARARTKSSENIEVLHGSAENLPLPDASVDVAHARFAYFFGEGAEVGLNEVLRVLRPGGTFIAVDNCWQGGDFAELLAIGTSGNAAIDPTKTDTWWKNHGAERVDVDGAWHCNSPVELAQILRIEFSNDVVERFLSDREPNAVLSYKFALFIVRKPGAA